MGDQAAVFQNRLRKNRKRLKRALPAETECYRLYDRDIPELPLIVDVYGARARIEELPGRVVRADAAHEAWLQTLLVAAAEVLELSADAIILRRRQRRRKGEQHERVAQQEDRFRVREQGLSFWVNLEDYVDTGLFMDHRPTRQQVRNLAEGKAVLNLFAYTCAFTVYAAAGGASRTVSVDLAKKYLEWGRANLEANELGGSQHAFVNGDAMDWMDRARHEAERFDLIVLDPPTLSRSKRMDGDLDVQRDHRVLIEDALALLTPGGTLWFSTNLKTFELDSRAFSDVAQVEEITGRSVPPDFRHQPHRCWRAVR